MYFKTGFLLRSLASRETGENVPDNAPQTTATMDALSNVADEIVLSFIADRLSIAL
jgi:hypothetical protein